MRSADLFEMEYRFEEIRVFGEAVMAWGKATLVACDEDGEYGFYVKRIKLDDGTLLLAKGSGNMGFPDPFKERLFRIIADRIEESKDAERKFDAAREADEGPASFSPAKEYGTYNATAL